MPGKYTSTEYTMGFVLQNSSVLGAHSQSLSGSDPKCGLAHSCLAHCSAPSLVDGAETPDVQDRLVYCYPIRLNLASPPQPRVELHFENDVACLRFKGEMVKVNRSYFSKLVRMTPEMAKERGTGVWLDFMSE